MTIDVCNLLYWLIFNNAEFYGTLSIIVIVFIRCTNSCWMIGCGFTGEVLMRSGGGYQ